MEKIIIIGGGVAGLSCLNAFLDKKIQALLIESGTIGTPKMCGEFIAPAACKILSQWQIGPIAQVEQAIFYARKQKFTLNFPVKVGAIARSEVECQLAKRARAASGRIRENTHITQFIPGLDNKAHEIYLSNGEKLFAEQIIFATGKINQTTANHPVYYGFKIHMDKIVAAETLHMFSLPNAYFGIVPISATTSNCACLVQRATVEKVGGVREYFHQLLQSHHQLKQIFADVNLDQITWLAGGTAAFQLKKNPNWPNVFWIGDALASLYPAIGSGFAHSVESAIYAAEYCLQHNPNAYHKKMQLLLANKLKYGKLMHAMLFKPTLTAMLIPFIKRYPELQNMGLRALQYHN